MTYNIGIVRPRQFIEPGLGGSTYFDFVAGLFSTQWPPYGAHILQGLSWKLMFKYPHNTFIPKLYELQTSHFVRMLTSLHVSNFTCHVSRATCHMSHIKCHMSLLFSSSFLSLFLQSGKASWIPKHFTELYLFKG